MNRSLPTVPAAESTGSSPHRNGWAPETVVLPLVNLLASIHIVWFYVYRVPSYLNLQRFEAGQERMPFQSRVLMQYPLRWAHGSSALGHFAAWLTGIHLWIPSEILPEDLVEAAVNLIAVLIAGLVARELYRIHSKTRLLTAYVYPLFLVMVVGSYCLQSINFYRYVYDLPSLGLLSVGFYLIARRSHPALFALLFVVATINRETSLFLLYFFLASSCVVEEKIVWRRAVSWRFGGTATLLGIFWIAWHLWTRWRFAGLHVVQGPGLFFNFACLLFPLTWPQLAGIAGYTLASFVLFRREIRSAELRLWLWGFPIWFAFMMYFGNMIELRIFGELIPLFACTAVLLAEERIHLRAARLFPGTSAIGSVP